MQPQRASAPDWPFKAQGTQLIGAISSIDFCSAAPHDYLVSAGTRLQLYNGANSVAKRQFTRFKDRAYGGSFRRDGRLIVAGCEDSVVQVGPLAGGGGGWRCLGAVVAALHCIALLISLVPLLAGASRSAACWAAFPLPVADATALSLPLCRRFPPQVFDSGSRTLLRQFKGGHKAPVHVAKFAADQQHVLTGGDDGLLILWDVISGQQVSTGQQHWPAAPGSSTGQQQWTAALGSTGGCGAG
jgi:WD40 repeat protein